MDKQIEKYIRRFASRHYTTKYNIARRVKIKFGIDIDKDDIPNMPKILSDKDYMELYAYDQACRGYYPKRSIKKLIEYIDKDIDEIKKEYAKIFHQFEIIADQVIKEFIRRRIKTTTENKLIERLHRRGIVSIIKIMKLIDDVRKET